MGSQDRHVGHGRTRATQVTVRRQNTRWDRTPPSGQATQRQKCKAEVWTSARLQLGTPEWGCDYFHQNGRQRKSEKRHYRQDSVNRTEEKYLIELMRQGLEACRAPAELELTAGPRNRNASYRNASIEHRNKIIPRAYLLGVIYSLSVGTMLAITHSRMLSPGQKNCLYFLWRVSA